jgi:hypothetical protein
LRLPDDEPIPFSLTRTGSGGWPLKLNIKKKIKTRRFRLPDNEPNTFSLTGTGRGGGPLGLKIIKKNKKKCSWQWRTDCFL